MPFSLERTMKKTEEKSSRLNAASKSLFFPELKQPLFKINILLFYLHNYKTQKYER
jgi:hypothetical protein